RWRYYSNARVLLLLIEFSLMNDRPLTTCTPELSCQYMSIIKATQSFYFFAFWTKGALAFAHK
ncbi:MAG: hypothetical protein AAB927_02035, partial [Patescibacteria group bacterium]